MVGAVAAEGSLAPEGASPGRAASDPRQERPARARGARGRLDRVLAPVLSRVGGRYCSPPSPGALTAFRARPGSPLRSRCRCFRSAMSRSGSRSPYAAFAVAWLALMWGDARRGLLFSIGLLLGPVALLGLMPIVALQVRGLVRRGGSGGSRCAPRRCRSRDSRLAPCRSRAKPLRRSESRPASIRSPCCRRSGSGCCATPALGLEAAILAIAAAALPLVARGSDLTIASFAALFLAATLLAAPAVSALPLVLCGWAVYVALTVLSRRLPERSRAQAHTWRTRDRHARISWIGSNRWVVRGGPDRSSDFAARVLGKLGPR